MTAQEIFEELNYKLIIDNEREIRFVKKKWNDVIVIFSKSQKKYTVISSGSGAMIDMPLLKAINQQCKELGWILNSRYSR